MTDEITIDLKAKPVSEDIRVWRLFPGKYYKFLSTFREQNLVHLDFPGLVLPDGAIGRSSAALRHRILASKAVEHWIQHRHLFDAGVVDGNPPQDPSRNHEDYTSTPPYDGLPGDVSAVRKLFGVAKKGDLVMVPARGRSRIVYIGEFISGPETRVSVDLGKGYLHEYTLAREVKWFNPISERRLPPDLSDRMRTQNTLIEIAPTYYPAVLDVAYGTYFFKNEFVSQFETTAKDFSDQDTLDIGLLAKLSASIASDFRHDQAPTVDINQYIAKELPDEDKVFISININSPGFLNARATSLAPLVFSALFALFVAGDANAQPPSNSVKIINSAAPDDEKCTADTDAAVAETLKNMLMAEWKANCLRSKRLASEPRLRSDSRARTGH